MTNSLALRSAVNVIDVRSSGYPHVIRLVHSTRRICVPHRSLRCKSRCALELFDETLWLATNISSCKIPVINMRMNMTVTEAESLGLEGGLPE